MSTKKSATVKKSATPKKSATAKKLEYPIPEDDVELYDETVELILERPKAKPLLQKKETILPGRFLFAEGVSIVIQKVCCNLWYTQAASKNMNTNTYEFGTFGVIVVPAIEKGKRLIQFTVTYKDKSPQKFRSFEDDLFRHYPSFESVFM